MSEPKAIETVYNGYRFRSKLEARWAVFMDAAQVAYDYEPEGFALPSGWYSPDFFLPGLDAWLEVKPAHPTPQESGRCAELSMASGKPVYIVIGQPGLDQFPTPNILIAYLGGCEDSAYHWCECQHCHAVGIAFEARRDRLPCRHKDIGPCPCSEHGDKDRDWRGARLDLAYLAARQARFDHGERGIWVDQDAHRLAVVHS